MRRTAALLVLVAGAILAPAALGASNPSFETGDLSGWDVNAPSGDAGVAPGGAPGGGSYFGGVEAGDMDQYQSISTTIYLQAGDAVGASASFYNEENPNECYYDDDAQVLVMLGGNVVGTIFSASSCTSGYGGAGAWGGNQVYVTKDGLYTIVARVRNVGDDGVSSEIWLDALAARIPRAAYCAGDGNTTADGSPIQAGSFLNLRPGQPAYDGHYTGATLALYVDGVGLTCDQPPAGFVQDGLAGDAQHVPSGLYAFYKQG